jgi:hypothetical protein
MMKLKTLIAMSAAGTFAWSAAHALQPMHGYDSYGPAQAHAGQASHALPADPMHLALPGYLPFTVSEAPASMSTLTSLDWKTGGYQGWGPMANPMTPINVSDSNPSEFFDIMNERALHLAAVNQAREEVWVANADLRQPYETAVGATASRPGGGILQFFRRR